MFLPKAIDEDRFEEPTLDRVLLVEDSRDSQHLVKVALEDEAQLTIAGDLAKALKILKTEVFDLLLLDVSLPDGTAFDLVSLMDVSHMVQKPRVIFLTADDELKSKLTGFSLGGDDYIVKPINPVELRARVLSHLRSRREALEASQTLQVGPLRINIMTGGIEVIKEDGHLNIETTPTEFRILSSLAKNPGHALPREHLQSLLPRGRDSTPDRTVDVHISKLRQKLIEYGFNIESIYGFGYRLIPPLEKVAHATSERRSG